MTRRPRLNLVLFSTCRRRSASALSKDPPKTSADSSLRYIHVRDSHTEKSQDGKGCYWRAFRETMHCGDYETVAGYGGLGYWGIGVMGIGDIGVLGYGSRETSIAVPECGVPG